MKNSRLMLDDIGMNITKQIGGVSPPICFVILYFVTIVVQISTFSVI